MEPGRDVVGRTVASAVGVCCLVGAVGFALLRQYLAAGIAAGLAVGMLIVILRRK